VSDFGLARVLGQEGMTATGEVLGTPSYMPPEQATGRTREVGPLADVYSLGAILYAVLTGRPPFQAATPAETLRLVVDQEPVTPRRLNASVPFDLQTVCLKCLEKKPERRYASAAALAEDLQRFLEGEPISARPAATVERAAKWVRRRPMVAALLGTVVLLSLIGLAGITWQYGKAVRERDRALTAEEQARLARGEAQRQLVELCGTAGTTAGREGDHSLALLWFTRALQLAHDDSQLEQLNRIRVANWLRTVCLPEGTFAVPNFKQNLDRFRAVHFSPDGNYLLVIASTGGCMVWDCQLGRLLETLGASAQGTAAAWQPRSGLLAVAGPDAKIRLLAPPDFRQVAEADATGEVAYLAFSRDGRRLAWGGSKGARVWDTGDKKYLTPLLDREEPVVTLSFSLSGNLLATASRDGKARVFRVPSQNANSLFPPVRHVVSDQLSAAGTTSLVMTSLFTWAPT
jgi:hypothetical protein